MQTYIIHYFYVLFFSIAAFEHHFNLYFNQFDGQEYFIFKLMDLLICGNIYQEE